jgi:hypothetical protein
LIGKGRFETIQKWKKPRLPERDYNGMHRRKAGCAIRIKADAALPENPDRYRVIEEPTHCTLLIK